MNNQYTGNGSHDPGLFEFPSPTPPPTLDPGRVDTSRQQHPDAPLAVRMRPVTLDEVVGQEHLIGPNTPLRRLVEGGSSASVILFGPPGTGKTTIASLISGTTGRRFVALSALSSGVREVRSVIADASQRLDITGERTVLFIDEVHRFSKSQQDALLAAVENRVVLLVAATTENPSFSVVSPLLSRSLVLQLTLLTDEQIAEVICRAVSSPRGYGGVLALSQDARDHLVSIASGDARRALTALEAAADVAMAQTSHRITHEGVTSVPLTLSHVESSVDKAAVRYDKDGDQHYDVVSAFIKSIRGSDVDAALHYLARMIAAGEDPRFIARRLVIHASEDIGMADSMAITVATAAAQAVQMIGMPEARINLAHATIYLATAPKSNSVVNAIDAAMKDVDAGNIGSVPPSMRDGHYAGAKKLGHAQGYTYPHDAPGGVVRQQYAPDALVNRDYYLPSDHGIERDIRGRLAKLRAIVRGRPSS